jgi:eukaryotic-like serine/threonine-protein kinase
MPGPKVGIDDDAATVIDATSVAPTEPRASRDSKPVVLPQAGYDIGTLIGRGGMGEVMSAHDRRIGRDVAIKRMRAANPSDEAVVRFLREARIQARLDHPAIVPVHELGVDEDGRPFFTMKRLAGVTLAQRISEGWPVTRLLRAFVDVCLAIEFAHTRGVVHRDLKPANIMMGDYGEVYVLDWGIARLTSDAVETPADTAGIDTLDDGTKTGELLGTPGYMAPEQIGGQAAGFETDVYALGSVLFEILTGEALHPRGTAGIASTLQTPQQSPHERVPEENIAPELDQACTTALAESPEQRPTARALGERVQKYLDGDRDTERRRALAVGELAVARAAFDSHDPEQRATAMRTAGRALALDPSSRAAAELVASLMVEPTKAMPKELQVELAQADLTEARQRARISAGALISVLSVLVVVPWMEIRNWVTFSITLGVLVGTVGFVWYSSRKAYVGAARVLIVTAAVSIAFTRVVGSFMLTPVITAGCLFAMCVNPWLQARRLVVYAWVLVVMALPLVLEYTGVFRVSANLADGGMCSVSPIFRGQGWPDAVALIVANFTLLIAMASFAIATNRAITTARHELRAQAWHLGQLLPTKIR